MSSLRINHNISALNSHRNMITNDAQLGKNLERLSSGMKINRAADGPAALVISEQMRGQIAGLKQAIMNSETAVSMIQTTEGALNEVNRLLVGMRGLAIHAANEGVNDVNMLEADQAELQNALDSIDRIARNTQFGTKYLLDGSNGVSGIATGDDLTFRGANTKTKPSGEGGFAVKIKDLAKQPKITGSIPLTKEIIDAGEVITLLEGGKSISYVTQKGDNTQIIATNVQELVNANAMNLKVDYTEDDKLTVNHRKYGSKHTFEVVSSTAGVMSEEGDFPYLVANGEDIEGSISDQVANGEGQFLTGARGTEVVGLQVHYDGDLQKVREDKMTEIFVEKEIMVEGTMPKYEYDANGDVDAAAMSKNGSLVEGKEDEAKTAAAEYMKSDEYKRPEVGRVSFQNHALKFQVGGNFMQTVQAVLPNSSTDVLGRNIPNESNFKNLSELDIRDFRGSQDAILLLDDAINQISTTRADLGAIQKNTLESNITSLRIAEENLVNSESVVRDSDMAKQMAEFTKTNILMSSATAMLAQANQAPNHVLSLLQGA